MSATKRPPTQTQIVTRESIQAAHTAAVELASATWGAETCGHDIGWRHRKSSVYTRQSLKTANAELLAAYHKLLEAWDEASAAVGPETLEHIAAGSGYPDPHIRIAWRGLQQVSTRHEAVIRHGEDVVDAMAPLGTPPLDEGAMRAVCDLLISKMARDYPFDQWRGYLESEYRRAAAGMGGVIQRTGYTHSEDFRSVVFAGDELSLTTNAAGVFQVLWEAADDGTPCLSWETIKRHVGIAESTRVSDAFRAAKLKNWRKYIVSGPKKTTYRLNFP